ncbi:MAG: hypothetical protein NTV86_11320 [Planctomycetota bacterium]|nr:hypothetical protein [Planctomycetota bacterium]
MTTDRIARMRDRVTTTPAVWDDGEWTLREQSNAATVGLSPILREAHAMAHSFGHRALRIQDGELIVGTNTRTPPVPVPPTPPAAQTPPPPPPPWQKYLDQRVLSFAGNHTTLDYETILAEGFSGLIARIDRRLASLPADAAEAREFLQALRIVAEGAIDFSNRHADLAAQLAAQADDAARREELLAIAANCRAVPAGPAKTFWQACQSLWFSFFLMPDSPGRVDQYLGGYYEADLREGRITKGQALELIECLWLKYFESGGPTNPIGATHHLTLGGVKGDGSDASNAVTWLCLEATERLKLFRPQVSLRWHRGTEPALLARAVQALRGRCGHPSFCSDEQIIPALTNVGVALADARNYSLSGCNEVIISGMAQMGSVEGFVNMPKALEMALGLAPELGPGADLTRIGSFEQFQTAVADALRTIVGVIHETSYAVDADRARWPHLMASLVVRDCIENARGYTQGGARYNFCNWNIVGIANLADSLAVVDRLVFREKRLALPALAAVLRTNWDGQEVLRRRILGDLPHYGNDVGEVDSLAAGVVELTDSLMKQAVPFRGGQYILGTLAGAENIHMFFGALTGATPDGRRAGEPLADSLGAAQGRDRHGPTAMLNSVAKIPHRLLPTATTINVKLDPRLLDSQAGLDRIAALIQGHFVSGGQQVQLTLVTRQMLEEAQADPASHGNVVVRVAGYSAPFVMLDPALQAEIISRTEHGL